MLQDERSGVAPRLVAGFRPSFGRFAADVIVPSAQRLFVSSSGSYGSNKKFFWGLDQTAMLAVVGKMLFDAYAARLREQRMEIYRAQLTAMKGLKNFFRLSQLDFSTVEFLSRALSMHKSLQDHFRQWYHILEPHFHLAEARGELEKELDKYIEAARSWEPGISVLLKQLKSVV